MNSILQDFARGWLRENLAKLEEGSRVKFKRLHSFNNQDISLEEVVDKIPTERLDVAMIQVSNTLKKNESVDKSNV